MTKPHGVFVDCGAFDGDPVELYTKAASYQHAHVYAIEPLPSVYEQLEKRITQQSLERVTLIREGVADNRGALRFISNGMYSTVTDSELTQIDGREVVEVSVSKLDDKFAEIKIDTLKMDIEGAEYNALLGADKLIKRDKPDLAI